MSSKNTLHVIIRLFPSHQIKEDTLNHFAKLEALCRSFHMLLFYLKTGHSCNSTHTCFDRSLLSTFHLGFRNRLANIIFQTSNLAFEHYNTSTLESTYSLCIENTFQLVHFQHGAKSTTSAFSTSTSKISESKDTA